uniref:Slc35b-3 n=1 Tax=Schmidtea mediterranea TaxID=79327 RepID=A0A0H3YKF4_SCHMD|nr:slc35b-3 [Schmidtea mediterranea]
MEGTRKHLFGCSLGIFFSYFFYGIIQEKITKSKFGRENDKFTCILTLVFIQCIINAIIAFIAMKLQNNEVVKSRVPKRLFAFCSLTYIGAMFASNYSLQHVNYPTQVLGKSAKPIPVMILGVLWAKKSYPLRKYGFVFMITLGVMLFLMKDFSSFKLSNSSVIGFGEILLLISLAFDGITGAVQDDLRTKYNVRAYDLMLNMNLWSLVYLFPAILISKEFTVFAQFIIKHPEILTWVVGFGLTSALGQIFIFASITNFGPLMTSIVTTTRKFFTILASVIIFQNPMNFIQGIGTGLVFLGLVLDQMYGKERKLKV